MSGYDPDQANGTLVASTVTTVNLAIGSTGAGITAVRVFNRDGTAEIWWSMADASAAAPTVGGTDLYLLPAAVSVDVIELPYPVETVEVKLISSGTPKYCVIGDRF